MKKFWGMMDLFTILIVVVFTCETFHLFYK